MDGYHTSLLCIILFISPKMGVSNMLTEFPLYTQISLEAAFENLSMSMENDAKDIGEEEFGRSKLLGYSISVEGQLGLEELSQCFESRDQTSVVDRWTECMELLSSHAPTVALPQPMEDIPSTGEIKREYYSTLREQNEKREEQKVGLKGLQVCSTGSAQSDHTYKFEEDEIKSETAEVDGESDVPMVRKVSDIDQFHNWRAEFPSSKEETEYEIPKAENSTCGKPENPLEIGVDGLRAEESVSVDNSKQLKLLKEVAMANDTKDMNEEEFVKTKQLGNSISVAGQLNLEELSHSIEAGHKMSSVERCTECINLPSSRIPVDGLPLFTQEISPTCVEKCENSSKLPEQSERGEETAVGFKGLQVSSADFEHFEDTHELEGQEIKSEIVEISGEADGLMGRNVSGIEEFGKTKQLGKSITEAVL